MSDDMGVREDPYAGGERRIAGYGMTDEDESVFRDWLESLVLQDLRYNDKAVIVLARESMVDEHFRSRVPDDPEGCLQALGAKVKLPEGFAVNFIENTETTLNVVLPPRAGTASERFGPADIRESYKSIALRERLASRTSGFPLFNDDWNISDPGTRDISIPTPFP
jgi:hypothetical protein